MNLRTKLVGAFVFISLLVGVVGYLGAHQIATTDTLFDDLRTSNLAVTLVLENIRATGIREISTLNELALLYAQGATGVQIREGTEELQLARQNVDAAAQAFADIVTEVDPDGEAFLSQIKTSVFHVRAAGETILQAVQGGTFTSLRMGELLGELKDAQREFDAVINEASDVEQAALAEISNTLEQELDTSINTGVIVTTVAVGLALIGGLALSGSIARPINTLKSTAERLAGGDYAERAEITTGDEIGKLAQSFNAMADTIQKRDSELSELNASLEQRVEQRTKELRKANAVAQESVRLKSEFMATMSHELRTPLNAILGFCGIILEGMGGEVDEEARGMLERVSSNGSRLLHLINQVLDLARIEAGRMELVSVPVSPRALAQQWQSQMQALAEQKHLSFEVDIDPQMPETLYADTERVTQIAVNLLGNAFKFTEQGGVKLNITREDNSWIIQVTDTGVGIPPHAINFIFDEFRQGDGSSRRVYGGSGLGLAIVRNLCMMMKGTVRCASELGKGSTFTATLPLQTEEHEPVAALEVA